MDSAGDVYVVGSTDSSDFPVAGDPLQSDRAGSYDAFVAKLSASRVLVYSTFLGGEEGDYGEGIAVDGVGNAYVTGRTASTSFPTQNPWQSDHAGSVYDAFVTKLNPGGSALVYSTFFGGRGGDEGYGMSVDSDGVATITGLSGSLDLPTTGVLSTTTSGSQDIFVARLEADGSQLRYSRYLGGSAGEQGKSLVVDDDGDVYVTGFTLSPNFPTADSLQDTLKGERDAFVVRIGQIVIFLPLVVK